MKNQIFKNSQKKVIAFSMHSFPLNKYYENSVDYNDRPLDFDPALRLDQSCAIKARQMIETGIDVYAQTVFYGNFTTPVEEYTAKGLDILPITLKGVEGIPLKVAVDVVIPIDRAKKYGLADMADFFKKIIEICGDHPNLFKYEDKLVIFLWFPFDDQKGKPGKFGPDDLGEVWKLLGDLRNKIHVVNETYYTASLPHNLVEQQWSDAYITKLLSVTDNLFWWVSWPWPEGEDEFRTMLLHDSLVKHAVSPMIESISSGYYRANAGWIKPFNGTRRMRELWNIKMKANPEWIYLVGWDDYSENFQIEKSRSYREGYMSLVRTLTAQWKGKTKALKPEFWVATPRVIMRGQETYWELINLNNPVQTGEEVQLLLEDQDGEVVYASERKKFKDDSDGWVKTVGMDIKMSGREMIDVRSVTPVVRIYDGKKLGEIRGIPPVRVSENHPVTPIYRFTRLDQIQKPQQADFKVTYDDQENTRVIRGKFLIKADKPVKRFEIRSYFDVPMIFESQRSPKMPSLLNFDSWKFGLPKSDGKDYIPKNFAFYLPLANTDSESENQNVEGTFTIDTRDCEDPLGMVYYFLEYKDGSTYSSKPYICRTNVKNTSWQGTVFDWGFSKDWQPLYTYPLEEKEALVGDWDFANVDRKIPYYTEFFEGIKDSGYYGKPLHLGYGTCTFIYKGTESNWPCITTRDNLSVLYFDGVDDIVRLPITTSPAGAMTLEMKVNPETLEKEQWMLFQDRAFLNIKLLKDGIVRFSRGDKSVSSIIPIQANEWSTIRISDDGWNLKISINGKPAGKLEYDTIKLAERGISGRSNAIFSILTILGGDSTKLGVFEPMNISMEYFKGAMQYLKVWCGVENTGMV